MIFFFNKCELDTERRQVTRAGRPVHIEPQVFDVLLHLIRHRERLVTKDELLDVVWQRRFVSEAALTSCISAARRAIGDSGAKQALLRTIARRGFRFCGEVSERASTSTDDALFTLPARTTSFLGRDRDVALVAEHLSSCRLLTLSGVGGVGKTSLALKVAARVAGNYPDGVRLVEFAAVGKPDAVTHALAGVLGVVQQPGKTIEQSVLTALERQGLLLVLDNCEHLLGAIAVLVREILSRCPHVAVLATSREVLAIEGEQAWPVPPLACDGFDSPAVRLFLERALAAAPDLAIDRDVETVIDICRRLDGLPLAIELAAARVRALSPAQIRDRLDDRFRLLTGGTRGGEQRHQTLLRAIQWSFELLSPEEKLVLSRASVFAGGFSLEAAEQICSGGIIVAGQVLDLLDSLARKSLVAVDRSNSAARYALLETIRQFGAAHLVEHRENDAVERRHAAFYAANSAAHFRIWLSPRQPMAYDWLEREMGNLRTAFQWARDHREISFAAEIASNIGDMARFRFRDEAANWACEIVNDARRVRHRRLIVLLTWASSWAWSLGRLAEAKRYGEEAIARLDEPEFEPFVWAYTDLGMIACYEGDVAKAADLVRVGATHKADRGDRFCLALLPFFLSVSGHGEEARERAESSAADIEAASVPATMSSAQWAKGKALADVSPDVAIAAYERAEMIARQSGNLFWEGMAVVELATLQARTGNTQAAIASFLKLLELWRRSNDLMFVSQGLGGLVVLLERLGSATAAATVSGHLAKTVAAQSVVPELSHAVARVHEALGDEEFEDAVRRGAALPLYEVRRFATEELRRQHVE